MIDFARRQRVLFLLSFVWITVLPAIYYQRLWQIFFLGPLDWIRENPSLDYFAAALRVLLTSRLSTWILPNIAGAFFSALISIIGAGFVLIAAQALGAMICTLIRCQFDNWIEKLIFRAGIGFGTLAYLSFGMALMGCYQPTLVRFLVLMSATSAVISYLVRFRGRTFQKPDRIRLGFLKRKATIWQTIALFTISIALIGALAPEVEYDALWYHLWLPKLWLERGSPVDLITEYTSLYPLTWEMVFGAGLSMGGPVAAKLLNFSTYLLSGMAIYQFVRRYLPKMNAWLAIVIWITTPTVLWEATTAYNDLALGFFMLLTFYAVIRYSEGRQKQWLALAGLNAGFALGTKHLALWFFALILAGLGIKLWLSQRQFKNAIFPVIVLAAIGLTLALPWYVRSWQASGNPVFPELYSLFGAKPPQRWDAITETQLDRFMARFGRSRTFLTLVTLPWDMTMHAASYGGNLGPIYLIFLPGLVHKSSRARLIPWLGWFVLFYLLFWASPLSSFQMRFLVPIAPLLAMLVTEGFERIREIANKLRGESVNRGLEICLALLCLFNLPPFTSLHELDRVVWDGWLTHVIHTVPLGVVFGETSKQAYLERTVRSYAAWQYINTYTPDDSNILTFSGGDHLYSNRHRIPSDATIARQVVWIPQRGEEQQMLEQIKSLGITHILFDKRSMTNLIILNLAIIQPEVIENWYAKDYEDANFILYRLIQD